ncbi:MAG TPA: POT family MFS transporter [Verrucomicrobiae bacterium]|nr:POT family MFS transporter [Verrucomicrobiae bacterium]
MVETKTNQMPRGIRYIVGNEAAERFSYYGMRSILVIFMTKYLLDRSGKLATMSPEEAKSAYHFFTMSVYFLPFFGAILADAFLGKFKTIMILSIVYCFGHFTLAIDSTRLGLLLGLGMIALGAGGIKPCVSATVGDQFTSSNQHLISRVYGWFYFSINFGSAFSTMWIPVLLDKHGPDVAFAVPGIFMAIATIIFWLGRKKFIHVPPGGMAFVKDVFGPLGRQTMLKLASIYVFVSVFWSLWDQTASAWVLQAQNMDLHFLGRKWLPSQIQTANPVFTLAFIPLFSYLIYPAIDKVFHLTPLRKIGLGLFLTVPAFVIPTWVENQISQGLHPNIGWHFLAYAIITAAEVMVSVTSLEFAYTQAPNRMKSFIMSFYLGAIALGNGFTALFNVFIQNPDKTSKLTGVQYYLFFDAFMLLTAIIFIFSALRYKEQTYIQNQPA